MNEAQVLEIIDELACTETLPAMEMLLRDHPELRDPAVDALLTGLIHTEARPLTREINQQNFKYLPVRAFLADYRVQAARLTIERASLPLAQGCPLPELTRLAKTNSDPEKRARLAEILLHQVRKASEPTWWAQLCYLKGCALFKITGGDRSENLRQAAAAAQAALEGWLELKREEMWKETLFLLDDIWRAYAHHNPSKNSLESLKFYQQELKRGIYDAYPLEKARLNFSLGIIQCQQTGKERQRGIETGITLFQKSIESFSQIRAGNSTLGDLCLKYVALAFLNLGCAYLTRLEGEGAENTQQAILAFQKALEFFADRRFPERYAEVLYNYALACRVKSVLEEETLPEKARNGQPWLEKGIGCGEEALKFYVQEKDPERLARTRSLLAMLYSHKQENRRENLEQAIEYNHLALEIFTRERFPVEWARIHTSLGNTCCDRLAGDRKENLLRAVAHYQQALEVHTKADYPQFYADTQNNLGTAYTELWAKGFDLLAGSKAIQAFEKALEVRHPSILTAGARQTGLNLGSLYFATGQWEKAWEAYQPALKAVENFYYASATEYGKRTELRQNATLYWNAAFAAARAGRLEDALLTLEHGKTRLLIESLQPVTRLPDETRERMRHIYEMVDRQALDETLSMEGPISASGPFAQAPQSQHNDQSLFDQASADVRQHAPQFHAELKYEDILKLVPDPHTALIAFCVTQAGSLGLILTQARDELQAVFVPHFTQERLDQILYGSGEIGLDQGWLGTYQASEHLEKEWLPVMEKHLDALGQELIQPVLGRLDQAINEIILLPTGGLFLAPLHAVPLVKPGCGGTRVCDRYQVSYIPSMKVLDNFSSLYKKSGPVKGGLLAVINPAAARRPLIRDPRKRQKEQEDKLLFSDLMMRALTAAVENCPPGEEPAYLSGERCTKEAVLAAARRASTIHFYTHGAFNWDRPAESHLKLAGGETLSLQYLQSLIDLRSGQVAFPNARLVTLTACETGIPETKVLPEEYTGLSAGFMISGVPCVVAALWKVPEIATGLLMGYFYQAYLSGAKAAKALQEAQALLRQLRYQDLVGPGMEDQKPEIRHLILRDPALLKNPHILTYISYWQEVMRGKTEKKPDERPFEHPFYWAAFTVYGV